LDNFEVISYSKRNLVKTWVMKVENSAIDVPAIKIFAVL